MNEDIDKMLDDLVGCVGRLAAQFFQVEEIQKDFEAWQKERQPGRMAANG